MKEIAGYEKEKKELNSLREMLHDIKRYRELGIRIPRGLLLYGEPGVGKTIMARSIADKGINLVELRAADCCEDEKDIAIREAFNKAKENAPSVLLLDELDKIAGTSRHFYMEGNDDVKKILLQELDKLTDDDAVLVVATCNIVECIGNTLLRAGRFDRQMEIKKPDEDTRKKIIKLYFDKLKIKRNTNIEYLAKIMHGCTGAEIECIINEAAIYATENNKKSISIDAIRKVMNKIAFDGSECQPLEDKEECKKIATHEAGHALVALALIPNNIYGVTILPQGNSGGHVQIIHEENKLVSSDDIKSEIAVLLAGRVAERTILGKTYLGSEADLSRAKTLAVNLLTKHAIGGYKLLMKSVPHDFDDGNASEECQSELDREFEKLMNQSDSAAETIIRNNEEIFNKIVNVLMEKQMMSRDELLAYKDQIKPSETGNDSSVNNSKIKEDVLDTLQDKILVGVINSLYTNHKISIPSLQKEFCIGYNRAGKVVDALEYLGIISTRQENGERDIIVSQKECVDIINNFMNKDDKNEYLIKNNGIPEVGMKLDESKINPQNDTQRVLMDDTEHAQNQKIIQDTYADFNIKVEPVGYICGPTYTRYDFKVLSKISIKKVCSYDLDLRMRLTSKCPIRIALIPGKNAIGIEVANKTRKAILFETKIKDIFDKKETEISIPLGYDINENLLSLEMNKAPHLLVSGRSGTGVVNYLQSIIASSICKYSNKDLRFILFDPRNSDFFKFNDAPHVLFDRVISDSTSMFAILESLIKEMENRYKLFQECAGKVPDIKSYNESIDEKLRIPRIVLVINEYSDLLEVNKTKFSYAIQSLAQKGRAVGIHIILATENPDVNNINSSIKVNIPSRLAFKVDSIADSLTILSEGDAEKLSGMGDCLFKGIYNDSSERLQTCFISNEDIKRIVDLLKPLKD